MIGAPQVINRTPASWANFYSPAGGITFTATTLTTTNAIQCRAHPLDPQRRGCLVQPDHHRRRVLRPPIVTVSFGTSRVPRIAWPPTAFMTRHHPAGLVQPLDHQRLDLRHVQRCLPRAASEHRVRRLRQLRSYISKCGLVALSQPPGFQLTTTPGIDPMVVGPLDYDFAINAAPDARPSAVPGYAGAPGINFNGNAVPGYGDYYPDSTNADRGWAYRPSIPHYEPRGRRQLQY